MINNNQKVSLDLNACFVVIKDMFQGLSRNEEPGRSYEQIFKAKFENLGDLKEYRNQDVSNSDIQAIRDSCEQMIEILNHCTDCESRTLVKVNWGYLKGRFEEIRISLFEIR